MRSLARSALGVYTVETGRDVSACQYSADIAGVKNGTAIETPPTAGFATAEPSATATQVVVKTYDTAGTRDRLAVQPAHRLLTSGRRPAPGGAAAPFSECGTSA